MGPGFLGTGYAWLRASQHAGALLPSMAEAGREEMLQKGSSAR